MLPSANTELSWYNKDYKIMKIHLKEEIKIQSMLSSSNTELSWYNKHYQVTTRHLQEKSLHGLV